MELQIFLELGLTGTVVGFMAGLLGLGGGLLMVPVLSFLLGNMGVAEDLSIKMAIVTSMSTILFTSISSVRTHHKLGAVRWDLVKGLAPGIVLGSALASLWIFVAVKGATLAILFGVFVSYSAFQMFMDKKPKPSRQMPGFVGQLGMGGLIGMLSGLVGAGGAFVSVPLMAWCNVAIHNAIGTSAALGFPIALANVAGFVISGLNLDNLPPGAIGYIWLPGLLGLGGGLLMVPVLSFMLGNMGVAEDLSIKMAIVTSMSTILFTSISSVRTHHKLVAVRWDLVKGLAPGILLGSALASLWIFVAVKGSTLAICLACLCLTLRFKCSWTRNQSLRGKCRVLWVS